MTQRFSKRTPKISKGASTPELEDTQIAKQVDAIALLPEAPPAQFTQPLLLPAKQTDLQDSPTSQVRWWGKRRLRFKVITLAVTLATLPVIGIGGAAYYLASQAFTQRVIAESEEYSISTQGKIYLFLNARLGDIQTMSQLDIFTDLRQRKESNAQQKQETLDRLIEAYPSFYDSIAVVDLKGNVIAQSIGEPLTNLSDRKYFQDALKANKPIISQPETGSTGILSVYAVAPIRDSVTNKTIALIRARIPGDYFRTAVLRQAIQRRNSKVYLVDGNDKVFVTSEGIGTVSVDAQGRSIVNAKGENETINIQSLFPRYAQLRDVMEPRVDLSSEELVTLIPTGDLRNLPSLGWKLFLVEDKASAFAAVNQLLLTLAIGVGIVTLLAGAIAALIANRTVLPILAATNAVTKIGQGDLDTRINVQGKDEIATLGININHMAAHLRQSLEAQAFEAAQERILTDAKGSGAVRASDLQAIFDQAVESVHDLLELDRVVIYRFVRGSEVGSGGVVSESVSAGWSSAIAQQVSDGCIPELVREAYRNGRVVAARDVTQAGFNLEHLKLLESLQVKASLIVPIVGADQLFGLLIAHSCSTTYDWQEFEINFLKRLAYEIGLTIYRVELLEQTTTLAEEQRQLKEGLQRRALTLLQEIDPISKGNLTIRAKVTADEIGTIADSYNATVDSLRKIVLQVKDSTHQVVKTTSTSETSVHRLSAEALRQAEEIAATLEVVKKMAVVVREVAVNAEHAEAAVQLAAETVKEGDAAMNRTVAGIQTIRGTVAETARKVKYLGESSQKISTVVELISAFAAQTNMLAMNASIAASRAGEEGRGFAVVADEVRALARQSAEATEEIRKLIINIQTETREVVAAMESGTEQVVTGTKLVDETRQSLNKITAVSDHIGHLVSAIAQATVVQSKASETVTAKIQDVATIANKTSSEADHVSASFAQLRNVAQILQESVGKFKVS